MRLLITGGAGFIGANFIQYILQRYPHYDVINFDKLTYAGNLENLAEFEDYENYSFVKGDICNAELVEHIIKDVDIVVHFAAESHNDRAVDDPESFIRTNILGTYTLLEAARKNGLKRFHHISTDEVFGDLLLEDPNRFDEDSNYKPSSPYSAAKASSDHIVRAYHRTFGLPITISNCSNNYGPYQFPEKIIPLFITNLIDGKKVPMYGDGKNVRDWIHVYDHCVGIDTIIHKGKIGETYCLGGDAEKSNLALTSSILKNMGLDKNMIEYVKDRPGHDRRYAINSNKAKAELGWRPRISFDEGIRKTVQWYSANQSWWRHIQSGEYKKYTPNSSYTKNDELII
jgi:dTDP-glucose 4,6-dehydratase